MNNKVISLKDWVPAQVKAHFLTEDEIDTWNAEYHESEEQSDAAIILPVQESLNQESEGVSPIVAAELTPEQ